LLAVNLDGQKELLGMWMSQTEGAKFWMSVLTEVQNRGVKDIFIAFVDGLTGLPEAIETVYPQTRVQLCMVHLMRNSLRYVSYKHIKVVATDLKAIYSSSTEAEAEFNLELKALEMGCTLSEYQQVVACALDSRDPTFCLARGHPASVIYTTNATLVGQYVAAASVTRNHRIFPRRLRRSTKWST
jgi:putative transposase